MPKCPKCKSKSKYQCQDCKYRQGRWSEKEIPEGYIESKYNRKGLVKNN